jgi:ribose transport system substrate-binding protein
MRPSRWSLLCVALVALAAAVGLTACGSSSGGGSSSSDTSTTSEVTEETEKSEGEKSEGPNEYAAALEEMSQVNPAKFEGPTEPAPAKPGTKIAAISCAQVLEGCAEMAEGIEAAAKVAGLQEKTFDGQGEINVQNKQILAAVSWGAEAIILEAIDPKTVQTGLAAAAEAGIVIGGATNGIQTPNEVVKPPAGDVWPAYDVSPEYKLIGEYEARWVVADSEGTANSVVYSTEEFIAANAQREGIMNTLEACGGCTTDGPIMMVGSQIGTTLGEEVVGYLRTHPEVDYLVCPYDPACPPIITSLQASGLAEQVKIVSDLGNEQNIELIRNEEVQAADIAYDEQYVGFAAVDQGLRLLDGQKPFEPQGENVPFQLLTKANLPEPGNPFTAPFDYASAYEKLWKAKG